MTSAIRLTILGLCLMALVQVGCGKATPPATPITYDATNSEANNGKQVSLVGYARLPVMMSVSDTMLIELHEQADGKGKHVNFDVPIGTGANQLEKPPSRYKKEDLKLHASDGTVVGPDDKIRVSGELVWMKQPGAPIVWLTKPIVVERI